MYFKKLEDDMSEYDCLNLVHNASFEMRVCPDVYWVPVNTLGQSRYTTKEMKELVLLPPEEKKQRITTLYEAVQLFIVSSFHETLDVVYIQDSQYLWEYHKPGYYAVSTNAGCCASCAAWMKYILDGKYEELSYFGFGRPNRSGHVYNCIKHNGWYYLYDLCTLTDQNMKYSLLETGNRLDYLKAKYISCALIKCKSLEAYAKYFARLQRVGGYDHLFFNFKTDDVPAVAVTELNNVVVFNYPNSLSINCLLTEETSSMKFCKINQLQEVSIDWNTIH